MKLQPRPLTSSLGSKYVMAITGLLLTGFVLIHMAGNLLVYAGPDALNSYAQSLKARPPLLWTARLGLLAVFVTHLAYAVRLRLQNAKARPKDYEYPATLQASWASRHMMLTGLVLLAFIVYHLAHFTLGVVKPAKAQSLASLEKKRDPLAASEKPALKDAALTEKQAKEGLYEFDRPRNYLDLAEVRPPDARHYTAAPKLTYEEADNLDVDARHDVYSMVIAGFRNPLVSASYILAMVFLGLHLWHGGSSWLQSLGIAPPGYKKLLAGVGPALALLVVIGNCSMPLYVMARFGVTF